MTDFFVCCQHKRSNSASLQ